MLVGGPSFIGVSGCFRGGFKASELWNAMINPLVPFGLSAVLWDQGENNAQYCTAPECEYGTQLKRGPPGQAGFF